jgi:mannosyltransferase
VLLLLICLLAAALRLPGLAGQSFWVDEGYSALYAERVNLTWWANDVHPPLYYALLSAWMMISDSDQWIRLLSVGLGIATIPVFYHVARCLFSGKAGLWAALLLAGSAYHVHYSREARMYALELLLYGCAFWGLLLAAREHRRSGWLLYVGSATLMLYTQALAPVYALTLLLVFPLLATNPRERTTWKPWILSNAIVALLFLPWLRIYLGKVQAVVGSYWIPPPQWTDPLRLLHVYTVSRIPSPARILEELLGITPSFVPGAWLWSLPVVLLVVWALLRCRPEHRPVVRALLIAYVFPIVLVFAVSLTLRPVFIARAFFPTLLPLILLLAYASELVLSQRQAWSRLLLAWVAILLTLATAFEHRRVSPEQFREASEYLQQRVREKDLLFYNGGSPVAALYLLARYDPTRHIESMPRLEIRRVLQGCEAELEICLGRALKDYPADQRIWLIHCRETSVRDWQRIASWLRQNLETREAREFRGVRVERVVVK